MDGSQYELFGKRSPIDQDQVLGDIDAESVSRIISDGESLVTKRPKRRGNVCELAITQCLAPFELV